MAGTKFKVTAKNDSLNKAKAKLAEARKQMVDLSNPISKAAVFLDQWVQRNFKGEGAKVGGWAPFAPATLRWIELYDPERSPAKLLQKTSYLKTSFLPFTSKNQAGIGSDVPYSKTHNEGLGHVPERRMLPKYKEVIKDVNRIMRNHVKESLRAAR